MEAQEDPSQRSATTRRWWLFGGLAAAVVALDQISKSLVDARFPIATIHPGAGSGLADPAPLLGDLVRIAKTYNDGGIFGLFGAAAPVLALASIAVIGVILVYQARQGARSGWLLSAILGLLLGGAVGNLIDRLRFGYVIDFVDMGIGDLRWYTFNVADAAISLSILGLLLVGLFGDRGDQRRGHAQEAAVSTNEHADAASGSAGR
ncbi:MAG: signal peptidase II [Chloroflexi bacterium]|nr:signal peptidase II [Chloroflexota bacterium]